MVHTDTDEYINGMCDEENEMIENYVERYRGNPNDVGNVTLILFRAFEYDSDTLETHCYTSILEEVIGESNININKKYAGGNTLLHHVLFSKNSFIETHNPDIYRIGILEKFVIKLYNLGADFNTPNDNGIKPSDILLPDIDDDGNDMRDVIITNEYRNFNQRISRTTALLHMRTLPVDIVRKIHGFSYIDC